MPTTGEGLGILAFGHPLHPLVMLYLLIYLEEKMRMMIVWDKEKSEILLIPESIQEGELMKLITKPKRVFIRPCKIRDDIRELIRECPTKSFWRIFINLEST